jgi:hypothetical protein
MEYELKRTEQYAQIDVKESSFDNEIPEALENLARQLFREDYNNLVVLLNTAKSIDNQGIVTLRKLNKLCSNSLGMLVVVTKDDDFADLLEDSKIPDLTILPTMEEAVDAIFMNSLENEFGADDDDYDEEDYNGVSEDAEI